MTRLTYESDFAKSPTWSSDGSRIAFVASRWSAGYGVYVMDVSAGAEAQLLASAPSGDTIRSCAWAPDGSRIAYLVSHADRPTNEIYVVPADGGDPELAVAGSGVYGFSWSPDGTRLAYGSDRGGNYDIWVSPVGGGAAVRLTDDPAADSEPAWAPYGTRIAFVSSRTSNGDLWCMPAEGGAAFQLTFEPEFVSSPSWSPNGDAIVMSSSRNSVSDIWTVGWL